MKKTIAVILAGGKGERFGGNIPKQFAKLAGKSVIEYSIKAFEIHNKIDKILIVINKEYEDRIWEIIKKNNFSKVYKVINGGIDRFGSTYAALKVLEDENENSKILFHDAVRPLIDEETITNVINALEDYEVVDTAIDATDTIIKLDKNWIIEDIPNRNFMKRGLTPQGFRLSTLNRAYQKAFEINKRVFTCDCGVTREMLPKIPIKVVKSTIKNIKITYPIDLYIAEKYIQMGAKYQFEAISLENLKDKKIVIFGHSSGIGQEIATLAKEYGAEVFGASRGNGVDIQNIDEIEAFLQKVGNVDAVIVSAAILIKKPFELMSLKEIKEIMNINYIGVVNVAYASKKYLQKRNGMLINFASSSYTRGRAYYALYSSSKAAVVNFTQALSEEWNNIRVNCVNPERTKTPMREKNFGYEKTNTLLDPKIVSEKTLKLMLSDFDGIVLDVKRGDFNV